ncbi:MAG: hypothetical protein ACRDP8_23370 [Actinopolymorphaceae bacterium]
MAAFLLLPTGADLTLADVETWVARAKALGASGTAPVQVGAPPLAPDDSDEVVLRVPVTVSRTILPGAAPASQQPEDDTDAEAEADAEPETAVDPESEAPADTVAEAENTVERSPVGMTPPAVSGAGSALAS